MLTQHDIVWGIAYPAIIAVIAMLLSHLPPWRRDARAHPWGPVFAIAAAFAIAFTGIAGWPSFPPLEMHNWLPFIAMGTAIIGIIATAMRRDWIVHSVLSLALILITSWLLIKTSSTPPAERWAWTAALAAGLTIWWVAMELLARRNPGPGLPILLAFFAAGSALVLADSGTISFAQLAGAVALAVGLIGLTALWFKNLSLSRGAMLALAVLLMGLIFCGHVVADVSRRDLIILGAAPLVLWLGQLPVVNRRPWRRFAVGGVVMFIVLSIAVVPAIKGLAKMMKEQTESYQY